MSNRLLLGWVLGLGLAATPLIAHGQEPAGRPGDEPRPATSNVRGAKYPLIHPDLRVTFQLRAPDAKKVQLQPGGADNGLGKGPIDMTRGEGEGGLWTVTTPPAVPGFHY